MHGFDEVQIGLAITHGSPLLLRRPQTSHFLNFRCSVVLVDSSASYIEAWFEYL